MIEIVETEPTLLDKIRSISEYYSPEHQLKKSQGRASRAACRAGSGTDH